jgi:hypothetical protein
MREEEEASEEDAVEEADEATRKENEVRTATKEEVKGENLTS